MNFLRPRALATSAIIAAMYAAITLLLAPISYGAIQFRISEALTVLPLFTPYAIPGLFIGCLLANLLGGLGIWDIVVGSLTTLIAAILTYIMRKNRWAALAPPVILNALFIGVMLYFLFTPGEGWTVAWSFIGTVGLGQLVSVYVAGGLLMVALSRIPGQDRLFPER